VKTNVAEFVERIRDADSIDGLRDAFSGSIADLGFDSFLYGKLHTTLLHDLVAPYVVTTFPETWRQRYFERERYRHDPVLSACVRSVEPVRWKDVAANANLDPQQAAVLAEAREHGLTNGLSVPVHGHNGQFSLISVVSPESDPAFDAQVDAHQHDVHLMSIYLHSRMQAQLSQRAADEINLTSRETECLLWTAHGKTAWEISMILKISEATVNYHLKNTMRKLSVHSKAHAVAKSMVLGLIQL
jgi:DNA-binding CsgD family transcriptional regulator